MTAKIIKAWWINSREIAVVFGRDIPFVPKVEVVGLSSERVFAVRRASGRDFAKYASYYISDGEINFLLDADNFRNIRACGDADYYVCGDFNGWGAAIGDPKWRMKPAYGTFGRALTLPLSALALKKRTAYFKFAGADGRWLEPKQSLPNVERDKNGNSNLRLSLDKTGLHVFVVSFDCVCSLADEIRLSFPELSVSCAVDFAERLLKIYSPAPLGVRFVGGKTVFSIFAPRANSACMLWGAEGERLLHVAEAVSRDGAVWTAEVFGDLSGAGYFWHIGGKNRDRTTAFDIEKPVADPYANAMRSSAGPSIVKFDGDLPSPKRVFNPPSWHDLTVMEIHLRDVLARAAAEISPSERLTFAGLEKWLASDGCYLRAAGVNCVELQPIQEFTAEKPSDYEWGYMPVNWFAPASSYATDPAAATQNDDFARLVDAFHGAGIAVVLDVVYNHVGEPNYLENVDKEYYFELGMSDDKMNFSGCGNDFRARAPMAKRMIVDSLKKLVLNYGVDGFRFDLAELLELDVLRDIETETKKIKPSIILIAEPWSFRGHIANALRETGFASWNDGFREFMLSYAQGRGDFAGFKYFIGGSRDSVRFCAQTVNYLESHDDMCLFDRLTGLYEHPSVEDLRRYKLAYALVLLSIGVPMLAEGFDLVRTKYGKNNTYKDGEANALDYRRGMRFAGVGRWLRALVKFRNSDAAAALKIDGALPHEWLKFYACADSSAGAAMFNSAGAGRAKRILAAFNPTDSTAEIALESEIEKNFVQVADIDNFDPQGIENIESPIANGVLSLPPISMALFVEK